MNLHYRDGLTYAPPRFPCTRCHVSHGGCTARWIAWGEPCCATCNHRPEGEPHE